MKLKRMTATALMLVFVFLCVWGINGAVSADETAAGGASAMAYDKYLQMTGEQPNARREITLTSENIALLSGDGAEIVGDFIGQSDVLCLTTSNSCAEYAFEVDESGFYTLSLEYCPIVDKGLDIRMELKIDGGVPFDGADKYVFSLIWKDDGAIKKDASGNDVRPAQIESPKFMERDFINREADYDEPFRFFFTSGAHTMTLTCTDGCAAVLAIRLKPPTELMSYAQAEKDYTAKGYQWIGADAEIIKLQAENAFEKSHITLYPSTYRNDAGVEPSDPIKICLNTVGGTNWSHNGEWISYQVEVPQTGLYALQLKALQNTSVGRSTVRRLYVDGEIPFREAANICFDYDSDWYIKVLGDDRPQLLYLTKGTHEIRLEAALGEIAPIIRSFKSTLLELNSIYRRIIMITGVSPDTARDYNLQSEIPDLIDRLMKASASLQEDISYYESVYGDSGTEISTIKAMKQQIDEFVARPRDIPSRLSSYKDNVSAFGTILNDLEQQPLMLDYICLTPPAASVPAASASLNKELKFGFEAFVGSFTNDYGVMEGSKAEGAVLEVWVASTNVVNNINGGTGRDQADVLRRLIDNYFTPETGIGIRLSLVDTGSSLIQATLAGKGPDVALMLTSDTPVNLAMRGALVDLSQYEGFEEITQRFYPQAMVPFEYNGGVYALPETQNFQMLFYRKDVFTELGLEAPVTWDDFYKVMTILQKNNMQVGIAESTTMFETLLYQRGESLYNEKRSQTRLKTAASIDAFKQWTDLYTQYTLDRTFDFYSRFRTGEMPLSIQPINMYSYLTASAPELRGLWDMASLPGIEKDGSVNHAGSVSGLCCFILNNCEEKDAAFRFLDWWTSNETQTQFGIEIEAVLGQSGRYYTANKAAFEQLPWERDTASAIKMQWEQTVATPQVPGNYYVARCLTNAFRQVIDHNKNPREQLFKYDNEINLEIERKRKEFGLD